MAAVIHRRPTLATPLVVLALVVGGCGNGTSGDDAASTSTSEPAAIEESAEVESASAEELDTESTMGSDAETAEAPVVPSATVSGPVRGGVRGFPFTSAVVDLTGAGYVEEEYFLEGTARAFEAVGTWSEDGIWAVAETSTAPYTTRLLVRRPVDPGDFNGTVVVEWFNVTSNTDLDPDFAFTADELLRGGYAWVGVSAQSAGVTSTGGGQLSPTSAGLIGWDPERYGDLSHPGDAYSYDIFSQAGKVLLAPGDVDPLGGLRPEVLLADGESQSAFRLLTYVNAIHPDAGVYDGFLIHSRNGTGAALNDDMTDDVPAPARIRDDLATPVFQIITETDLFDLGTPFPEARQPDTDTIRTWELAGTAHADSRYLESLLRQGNRQFDDFLDLSGLLTTVNTAPQHMVMNAALHALAGWARGESPPATAPSIETEAAVIVRDEYGNALGGLRLPHVDVPIALVSGEDGIPLSGRTEPFDDTTLDALYPDHESYVAAVEEAADRAVEAGYLLPIDAATLVAEARDSTIGTQGSGGGP